MILVVWDKMEEVLGNYKDLKIKVMLFLLELARNVYQQILVLSDAMIQMLLNT
jgi:hypothetical protein